MYRVLLADPPWKFGDSLPGKTRGASKQYLCLSVAEICAFPIPALADDSILFLWRVSSMVEEAYQVVRAWGFVPKSEIVWEKLTKNGKPHFGMGRYVRASHETCIVATRGRFKVEDRGVRSRFSAKLPVGADGKVIHSAKPDEFYGLVERLSPGPYVELFARRTRAGWVGIGDQCPSVEAAADLVGTKG
jgi:N6-adenosine-specific RNA methylase IME4